MGISPASGNGTHPETQTFQPEDDTLRQEPAELGRSRTLSRSNSLVPGRAPGYEIGRCLGEGSFGSVWLATEMKTGRQVAIKFYTHRKGLDWSLLSREVEKLAVLYTSRNVVGLLDVGWDHDPPYFVMEYLAAGPLSAKLQGGPLPVPDAVRIAKEVLNALVHAHNSGILHCDVKPANILLDSGGSIRLGDFGQSRLTTEQSPAQGTLFYMAPEQAMIDGVPDARWDVYALGALLYHMLTGAPPYRTAANEERLRAARTLEERLAVYRAVIAQSLKPDAHRHRSGVDWRLADIVDKCLAREPHERWPNAQVVLDHLAQREQALSKRSLMVLGIVGPALFLITLLTLASGAIPNAVAIAERNLVERAMASDSVAAQILASSVNQEFDIRLKELEDVADNLSASEENGEGGLRSDFEEYLDRWQKTEAERLAEQKRSPDESIFVTNAGGMQIYRYPRDSTLGQNFAFRDYFHGLGRELSKGEIPKPREKSGISLAYRSSSSKRYKVSIATPIWNSDRSKVLGVLARSINLSDVLNQWEARIQSLTKGPNPAIDPGEDGWNRLLALVDRREKPPYLIDHPWMSEQAVAQLQDEQLKTYLKLPPEQVERLDSPGGRSARFEDPIGKIDPRFSGQWLAAFAPVGDTGWTAIVQEKRATAVEPVNAVRNIFLRYGLIGLAAFIAVFALLWTLIRRAAR